MLKRPLRVLILGLILLVSSAVMSLSAGISVYRPGPASDYTVNAARGYSLHPIPTIGTSYFVVKVPSGFEAYLPDQRRLEQWLATGGPFDSSVPRENDIAFFRSVTKLVIFNPGSERQITVRLTGLELEKPYLFFGVPGAVLSVVGVALVLPALATVFLGGKEERREGST